MHVHVPLPTIYLPRILLLSSTRGRRCNHSTIAIPTNTTSSQDTFVPGTGPEKASTKTTMVTPPRPPSVPAPPAPVSLTRRWARFDVASDYPGSYVCTYPRTRMASRPAGLLLSLFFLFIFPCPFLFVLMACKYVHSLVIHIPICTCLGCLSCNWIC